MRIDQPTGFGRAKHERLVPNVFVVVPIQGTPVVPLSATFLKNISISKGRDAHKRNKRHLPRCLGFNLDLIGVQIFRSALWVRLHLDYALDAARENMFGAVVTRKCGDIQNRAFDTIAQPGRVANGEHFCVNDSAVLGNVHDARPYQRAPG
jgi:hypothetical protein